MLSVNEIRDKIRQKVFEQLDPRIVDNGFGYEYGSVSGYRHKAGIEGVHGDVELEIASDQIDGGLQACKKLFEEEASRLTIDGGEIDPSAGDNLVQEFDVEYLDFELAGDNICIKLRLR